MRISPQKVANALVGLGRVVTAKVSSAGRVATAFFSSSGRDGARVRHSDGFDDIIGITERNTIPKPKKIPSGLLQKFINLFRSIFSKDTIKVVPYEGDIETKTTPGSSPRSEGADHSEKPREEATAPQTESDQVQAPERPSIKELPSLDLSKYQLEQLPDSLAGEDSFKVVENLQLDITRLQPESIKGLKTKVEVLWLKGSGSSDEILGKVEAFLKTGKCKDIVLEKGGVSSEDLKRTVAKVDLEDRYYELSSETLTHEVEYFRIFAEPSLATLNDPEKQIEALEKIDSGAVLELVGQLTEKKVTFSTKFVAAALQKCEGEDVLKVLQALARASASLSTLTSEVKEEVQGKCPKDDKQVAGLLLNPRRKRPPPSGPPPEAYKTGSQKSPLLRESFKKQPNPSPLPESRSTDRDLPPPQESSFLPPRPPNRDQEV